jgi:hypothetical protein
LPDQRLDQDGSYHPDARGERRSVVVDPLLGEQVADRVDDGRHRLVLGEGAYRAGHGVGGH